MYSSDKIRAEEFFNFARENGRKEEVKFLDFQNTGALIEPGILFYPGLDISFKNGAYY